MGKISNCTIVKIQPHSQKKTTSSLLLFSQMENILFWHDNNIGEDKVKEQRLFKNMFNKTSKNKNFKLNQR